MSRIKITNIIAKSYLVPPFSLSSLLAEYPPFSQSPFSRIFLSSCHTNFSVLLSGSVISRASRSFAELEDSFHWLRSFLSTFNLTLSEQYEVFNVVAFSDIAPPLNLLELASHLPHSSYDPSPISADSEHHIDSIVFSFNSNHSQKPRRTALIFHTGNATLTGFFSFYDLLARASQLSSLIAQIAENHPAILEGE